MQIAKASDKSKLSDQGKEDDLRNTTAEQRLKMMWQLAVNAWAMKGENVVEQEFQEMLTALTAAGVEYLVVGAHALAVRVSSRDWGFGYLGPSDQENAERVWQAIETIVPRGEN